MRRRRAAQHTARPPRELGEWHHSACNPLYLQVLDRYFGNVCELDLIFNFHKAYHILDELLISGVLSALSIDCPPQQCR